MESVGLRAIELWIGLWLFSALGLVARRLGRTGWTRFCFLPPFGPIRPRKVMSGVSGVMAYHTYRMERPGVLVGLTSWSLLVTVRLHRVPWDSTIDASRGALVFSPKGRADKVLDCRDATMLMIIPWFCFHAFV